MSGARCSFVQLFDWVKVTKVNKDFSRFVVVLNITCLYLLPWFSVFASFCKHRQCKESGTIKSPPRVLPAFRAFCHYLLTCKCAEQLARFSKSTAWSTHLCQHHLLKSRSRPRGRIQVQAPQLPSSRHFSPHSRLQAHESAACLFFSQAHTFHPAAAATTAATALRPRGNAATHPSCDGLIDQYVLRMVGALASLFETAVTTARRAPTFYRCGASDRVSECNTPTIV